MTNNKKNQLKKLDLAYNQLSDTLNEKQKKVFSDFFKNTQIETLYLDHNQIGDAFAQTFASSIKNNLCLSNIFLSHNQITNIGALAIAKTLIKIVHLEKKLDLKSTDNFEQEVIRVVARAGAIVAEKINGITDKNILVVRIFDEVEKFHENYIFLSAGLGGKHPKVAGASASHTEQIWMGIQDFFIGNNKKIEWTYSTKEACNKNNSIPTGCRTIPGNEMGMSPDSRFYSTAAYKTAGEKEKISPKKLAAANRDKLRRQNSRDYFINSDSEFRGKELKEIKEINVQHYPPKTKGIEDGQVITARRK